MQWLREFIASSDINWTELAIGIVLNGVVFFLGMLASWFLFVRRNLRDMQRLQSGDSDDFIFQMHVLWPVPGSDNEVALLFRNIAPNTTLNALYDNPAARSLIKQLGDTTTLADPVLKTEGQEGFEILNTALGHLAGYLSTTPFSRQIWLFSMTCEDRQAVRKKCVRCFLIRPEDLQRFLDWNWCRTKVRVERPRHWFRVVALHRIARIWQEEQQREFQQGARDAPLIDKQAQHHRIQELSLGLNTDEMPVAEVEPIHWESRLRELQKMGLSLEGPPPAQQQVDQPTAS